MKHSITQKERNKSKWRRKYDLDGEDSYCEKYLSKEAPINDAVIYEASHDWIVMPYFNNKWTEDKVAFSSKEKAIHFCKVLGIKYEISP